MIFDEKIKSLIPQITPAQIMLFRRYFELLIEWNNKFNLTTITQQDEVIQKHFADSVLPLPLIKNNACCVDIGAGAGFPSIPLLIMRDDINMLMLDSLNKRIGFLDAVCAELGLSNRAQTIHMRVEDAGQSPRFREKFDIALSRAVAPTNILAEWSAPLLCIGGIALMYKGSSAHEEADAAAHAFSALKLKTQIHDYDVEWGARSIITATKYARTSNIYPRKPGIAKQTPL